MAKWVVFRRYICDRTRRADVVIGPQRQPQEHAFTPDTL